MMEFIVTFWWVWIITLIIGKGCTVWARRYWQPKCIAEVFDLDYGWLDVIGTILVSISSMALFLIVLLLVIKFVIS